MMPIALTLSLCHQVPHPNRDTNNKRSISCTTKNNNDNDNTNTRKNALRPL